MLADKIINSTYHLMSALNNGKADEVFINKWLDTMIDITEGVKDLEGSTVPERQRVVATGPNVIDFMSHRTRLALSRPPEGSRL